MFNSLKKEIEKDFNKEKNFREILSKVEGVSSMKNFKLIYVLASVCMILVVVVGYVKFSNSNNILNNNSVTELSSETKEKNIAMTININKSKYVSAADVDGETRILNGVMIPYFEFMSGLAIPEDFDNKEDYRAIYVRSDKNTANYDILNNYVFHYRNTSNNRNITISFSDKYEPLRCYGISETEKKSQIGDTELIISQYNSMYIVKFKHKGINYDIETNDITREELVTLLKSMIK